MPKLSLKHLLAIRWFHWINFPLLFLMIWSGMLIYWAYPIYHLGPIALFPQWLFELLGLKFRLAEGMALHFVFMSNQREQSGRPVTFRLELLSQMHQPPSNR